MKKVKRIVGRRLWKRKPQTQIVPNRKKNNKKFSDTLLCGQKIKEKDLEVFNE